MANMVVGLTAHKRFSLFNLALRMAIASSSRHFGIRMCTYSGYIQMCYSMATGIVSLCAQLCSELMRSNRIFILLRLIMFSLL